VDFSGHTPDPTEYDIYVAWYEKLVVDALWKERYGYDLVTGGIRGADIDAA
jgi:hypothetical protein